MPDRIVDDRYTDPRPPRRRGRPRKRVLTPRIPLNVLGIGLGTHHFG